MMTFYLPLFVVVFSGAAASSGAAFDNDAETRPIIVTSTAPQEEDDTMHLFKNIKELPKYAMALGKLADKLVGQGSADEARKYYSSAIRILESSPPQDPSIAMDLAGFNERLAAILLPDDVDGAVRCLESAVGYYNDSRDRDYRYARLLATLASCYARQGKKEEAETTLDRALEVPPPPLENNPRVAMDRASMLRVAASVYEAEGNYDRAKSLYLESVELRERFLPPNSVDLATSFHDVGRVLVSESLYDQAEIYLDRAKLIFESINHPDLPIFLATSAECKRNQRKLEDARVLYERAILIREGRDGLGDGHASTLREKLLLLDERGLSGKHTRFFYAMRIASVVLLIIALCGLTYAQQCQAPQPPPPTTVTPKTTHRASPNRRQNRNHTPTSRR